MEKIQDSMDDELNASHSVLYDKGTTLRIADME